MARFAAMADRVATVGLAILTGYDGTPGAIDPCMTTALQTINHDRLAQVSGGFDLGHAIDAGNAMAPKAAEAGGYVGAGAGAVTGFVVGSGLLGITAIPGAATGIAAGGAAGSAIGGALGFTAGASIDTYRQLKGR
jgi:hypothetical protein